MAAKINLKNYPLNYPDLTGYQLVIYNTDVISNPDNLTVSSRTIYYFQDENTILGDGEHSEPIPAESWIWNNDSPGDIINTGVLDIDYGDAGAERFVFTWDGYEENVENAKPLSLGLH